MKQFKEIIGSQTGIFHLRQGRPQERPIPFIKMFCFLTLHHRVACNRVKCCIFAATAIRLQVFCAKGGISRSVTLRSGRPRPVKTNFGSSVRKLRVRHSGGGGGSRASDAASVAHQSLSPLHRSSCPLSGNRASHQDAAAR